MVSRVRVQEQGNRRLARIHNHGHSMVLDENCTFEALDDGIMFVGEALKCVFCDSTS